MSVREKFKDVASDLLLRSLSPQKANALFHLMSQRKIAEALKQGKETVALRTVWEEAGFDPDSVMGRFSLLPDMERFKEAPVLDDKNYAKRFSIHEKLRPDVEIVSFMLSGGFSGGRKYTIFQAGDDQRLVGMFSTFLKTFYGLRRDQKTLAVVTFFLGPHGAGMNMSRILSTLGSEGGFDLTLITPGLDISKTADMLSDLGGSYDTWFLFGYPTAIGVLAQELKQRRVPMPKTVHLFVGAEGHTIPWVRNMADIFGIDLAGDFESGSILSNYGAVDLVTIAGIQDMEALQVALWADEDRALAADLFPNSSSFAGLGDPMIFKAPPTIFIENGEGSYEGELLFTGPGSAPIVRLTLNDLGYLVPREKVLGTLAAHGYDLKNVLAARGCPNPQPMDFLLVWGRKGSASVWGITVALRVIRDALDTPEIVDLHTGYIKISPARFAGEKTKIRITLSPDVGTEAIHKLKGPFYKALRSRVSEVDSLCNEGGEGKLDEAFELVLYEYNDPEGPYHESIREKEMKLKWID